MGDNMTEPEANFACPGCNCQWFTANIAVDDKTGRVTARSATAECLNCGMSLVLPP